MEYYKTDGIKTLYHGTSKANSKSILKMGYFDSSKRLDDGWGETYGKAVYLTPNLKTAQTYANDDGIVLVITINIIPYRLERNYSPSNHKHKKIVNKLIELLKIDTNYNCLLNLNGDEIVYFGSDIHNKSKLKISTID
jgi:hypothetical protein